MKALPLFLLAISLVSARAAEGNPDVNARLKALEEKVARLSGQAPPRWATVDHDRLRKAIYALGREKLEAHKQAEKLTPEQAAQVENYELLNQQLLRMPPFAPTFPPRSSALVPLPPTNLTGGQPPKPAPVVPPPAPASSGPDKDRDQLVQRVAEAKAPIAAIVERRNQINTHYILGGFLEKLVADYAKSRFDLVVNAESRYSSERTILYRASVSAPDITDELLNLLRERERDKPPAEATAPAK